MSDLYPSFLIVTVAKLKEETKTLTKNVMQKPEKEGCIDMHIRSFSFFCLKKSFFTCRRVHYNLG